MFKKGDKVQWKKEMQGYSAKAGATATVTGVNDDKDLLYVIWDRDNELHMGQQDGGYFINNFKLTPPKFNPGDQVFVRDDEDDSWQGPEILAFVDETNEEGFKYIIHNEGCKYYGFKQCKFPPQLTEKQIKFFIEALECNGYEVNQK